MLDRSIPLGRLALLLLLSAGPLRAQRVLGAGEDAVTLPRGAIRVGIGGVSTVQRDGWRDGSLQGLAGSFTGRSLGVEQLPRLAGTQQSLRDLGLTGFIGSLGAPTLDVRQRLFVTPLSAEYGVADWLTLGARATLVRTRTEARFTVNGDSASLGLNPIRVGSGVAASNQTAIDVFASAGANLFARRNACQLNPASAPECPTINAEVSRVSALTAQLAAFANSLQALYGGVSAAGQRYVPRAGSSTEAALIARVDSMRSALERYGITTVTATSGLPLGAQTALSADELDAIISDSTAGFGAAPLDDGGLTALGDVELAARIKVFDSFGSAHMDRFSSTTRGVRQTLVLTGRIGTGTVDRPDALLDQGSGSGTNAIGVRSVTDVVFGRHAWLSVAVGGIKGFSTTRRMRVPSSEEFIFLEAWREADVEVEPGLRLDASLSPQWLVNDFIALGGVWQWRRWAADEHRTPASVTDPDGNSVTLLPSALDASTRASEHAVGLSATFSTLASRARGSNGLALELTYQHLQSIASGVGIVPKRWEDRLVLRYYTRFFRR